MTADPSVRKLVVALDGPASSGKSTVGALAAAALGYRFCDTGLFYRALTWLALREGVPPGEPARVVALLDRLALADDGAGRLARVIVDGADVADEVRTGAIDAAVSGYARIPEVRERLLARQRDLVAGGGIVMAGRDIGTVVLPDADVKIFLDASAEERARRRWEERGHDPDDPEARRILEELRRRDGIDASREVAPLRAAPDAVVLVTDGLEREESVARVVHVVREAAARTAPR